MATGYSGTIHFSSSDGQAELPADETFLPADMGSAAVCCVSLRSFGAHTVTVSDTLGGISPGSQSVQVGAAPSSMLQITGLVPTAAGATLSPIVTAVDAYGNEDPSYRGTVRFTSSDFQGSLPGDYTFTVNDGGSHGFANGVVLRTAGVQSITATDVVTSSMTGSSLVSVAPGPAALLTLTTPNTATAGSAFSVAVLARDVFGNQATSYAGAISFSSSDGQASLPAAYSFTPADAGFKGDFMVTMKSAGPQTISIADGSFSITSGAIQVGSGAAQSFIVSGFPNPAMSGVPGSLTVEARDGFGNRSSTYQGTVQFSSSDPSATLPAATPFLSRAIRESRPSPA